MTKAGRADAKRGAGEAERLTRLIALAKSIWRDEAAARRFLSTPHAELEGRPPLELATTEAGARQVERVIERGRNGLPL